MTINWDMAVTIAAPTIALFIGALINHLLENRPKVISYISHVSGIRLTGERPIHVFTHAIVLRNAGGKTSTNVRIGHNTLPNFEIFPDIEHTVNDLPGGGKEIVIPRLIPKKQVTITYLYHPPLTYDKINTHIESDEGPVKQLTVIPARFFPKWVHAIIWFLLIYGIIGLLYTFFVLIL